MQSALLCLAYAANKPHKGIHKGGRREAPPPFVEAARSAASLMRLVGSIGKAKQGRLQGKTNSAEPRQSKPGSRAKSVRAKGPKGPCKGPIHKCWAKGPKGPCMGPIPKKRILLDVFK